MKKPRNLIKCSACPEGNNLKKPSSFYKAKNKRGYQSKCRDCQRAYHSELLRKYRIPLVKMGSPSPVVRDRPCLGYCGEWFVFKDRQGQTCPKCKQIRKTEEGR